jgi:hypothetical protein
MYNLFSRDSLILRRNIYISLWLPYYVHSVCNFSILVEKANMINNSLKLSQFWTLSIILLFN